MPLLLVGLLGVFAWKVRNDFIQTGTPITPQKVDEVFNYALTNETDVSVLKDLANHLQDMGRGSQALQLREKASPINSGFTPILQPTTNAIQVHNLRRSY